MRVSHKHIVTGFRAEGDPDIVKHSSRFFKTGKGEYGEGDAILGIRVPIVRKYVKQYRLVSLNVAEKLLHSKYHEERLFGVLLLVEKFKSGSDELQKDIFDLYLGSTDRVNNWDLVDSSAPYITGPYLVDKDRRVLRELAVSESLWERRIAIVSTYAFIRIGDFQTTLMLSELLLSDTEDLIHKAVGWMLREVGNRAHNVEVSFLKKTLQTYAPHNAPLCD